MLCFQRLKQLVMRITFLIWLFIHISSWTKIPLCTIKNETPTTVVNNTSQWWFYTNTTSCKCVMKILEYYRHEKYTEKAISSGYEWYALNSILSYTIFMEFIGNKMTAVIFLIFKHVLKSDVSYLLPYTSVWPLTSNVLCSSQLLWINLPICTALFQVMQESNWGGQIFWIILLMGPISLKPSGQLWLLLCMGCRNFWLW